MWPSSELCELVFPEWIMLCNNRTIGIQIQCGYLGNCLLCCVSSSWYACLDFWMIWFDLPCIEKPSKVDCRVNATMVVVYCKWGVGFFQGCIFRIRKYTNSQVIDKILFNIYQLADTADLAGLLSWYLLGSLSRAKMSRKLGVTHQRRRRVWKIGVANLYWTKDAYRYGQNTHTDCQ